MTSGWHCWRVPGVSSLTSASALLLKTLMEVSGVSPWDFSVTKTLITPHGSTRLPRFRAWRKRPTAVFHHLVSTLTD